MVIKYGEFDENIFYFVVMTINIVKYTAPFLK